MSLATLSPAPTASLADAVDSAALKSGGWVVIEQFGSVLTHGVGPTQCPPQLTTALLAKRTASLRAGVRWARGGRYLHGTLDGMPLAAVELGEGTTAWFIGGTVVEDMLPLLAGAAGDDPGPVLDPVVDALLHPRGPSRPGPAPPAVLLALTCSTSLRALIRAAVAAASGTGARVHTDDQCVVVAAASEDEASRISQQVHERCPDARGGLAVVAANSADWVSAARLALACAVAGRRLGVPLATATQPAIAVELLIIQAGEAALSLTRELGHTPLSRLYEQDARTSGELVQTVRAWCDSGCDSATAAAQLHVHVNTLRYRIRRASEISGLDFSNPRHVLALQLLLAA